ncbi:MAG: type III-A CRISPR-associated RAMP protein Csm4 [Bacteroidota bacterium]
MKTDLKIYRLYFKTPLHLGDEKDDYSISLQTFRSDAMYAALMATLAKLGYKIPENGDLGFSISSLFPFYQGHEDESKPVLFFPKNLTLKPLNEKFLENVKKIKKVRWLDLDNFQKQINGENPLGTALDLTHVKGNFLTAKNIDENFISSQISPRVTVSRTGMEDARPFYMDRVFFRKKSGLFFIAKGDNIALLNKALDVLKDEGIGTDRNVGNGFFTFEDDVIQLDLPEKGLAMSLSMYCPENKDQLTEMLQDNEEDTTMVSYDFVKRGGWITTSGYNTFRKNSIYMFTEGSIFKKKIDKITISGKIADLTPIIEHQQLDHKVFRNGRAIFIPVNTN